MIILGMLEGLAFFGGIAACIYTRWDIAAVLMLLAVYFNQKGGELE